MEQVTGATSHGFATTTSTSAASPTISLTPATDASTTTALDAAASPAVVSAAATASAPASGTTQAWADTRLSGADLRLTSSAAARVAGANRSAAQSYDLFGSLRSALTGLNAQTGFNELAVRYLLLDH